MVQKDLRAYLDANRAHAGMCMLSAVSALDALVGLSLLGYVRRMHLFDIIAAAEGR